MSGVIDENGVQWEHCNGCKGEGTSDYSERGKWVKIEDLFYEPPSEKYECGRDLCFDCAALSPTSETGTLVTISIPADYLGNCTAFGHGCKNDATHMEYMPFNEPLVTGGPYPPVEGVWHGICDSCCDPKVKHE